MMCCNNITERLTGIALPLHSVTVELELCDFSFKVLALLSPQQLLLLQRSATTACVFVSSCFPSERELWLSRNYSVETFKSL